MYIYMHIYMHGPSRTSCEGDNDWWNNPAPLQSQRGGRRWLFLV